MQEKRQAFVSACRLLFVSEATPHKARLQAGSYWNASTGSGVTKGAALQGLQERMGITPAETMAFGDYDNDISMLQHAEFSYAMENASERVRQQAKHIAPANTKNGVVRVLCETLGIHMESL